MWLDKATSIARDAAILEGHAKGATQIEIAERLGLTRQAVSLRAQKLGLQFRKRIDFEKAREMARDMPLVDVARKLGISRSTLWRINVTKADLKPWSHGITGYTYHKCRCEVCRRANTQRAIAYYHRKKALGVAEEKR